MVWLKIIQLVINVRSKIDILSWIVGSNEIRFMSGRK